jgi:hypothetical protein
MFSYEPHKPTILQKNVQSSLQEDIGGFAKA